MNEARDGIKLPGRKFSLLKDLSQYEIGQYDIL